MARSKFVHKIGLGVLVGLVLFGVFFTTVFGLVTSVNAIAMDAGSPMPFSPAYAFPLLVGFVGFVIPVAGIISQDFDQRQENEDY